MRVHREGYIQARELEVVLPIESVRRAKQAYPYITLGFELEVEKEIGITIDGAKRVRAIFDNGGRYGSVLIESDWARPTRR